MIPRLPGWTRSERDDLVFLTRGDAVIRYRERCRPMHGIADQVAAVCAAFGGVAQPVVTLVTDEGEAAALAIVRGVCEGTPVAIVVGTVMGDDFHTSLIAHTPDLATVAALAADVRSLLERDVLALGVGRRVVMHDAPAGWTTHRRGLAIDHVSPSRDAVLRVFAAEPSRGEGSAVLAAVAGTLESGQAVDTLEAAAEVAGWSMYRMTTTDVRCDIAVLRDAAYEYAVVLESHDDVTQARHRPALHGLLASITPRAPITRSDDAAVAAFAYWTQE